MGAPSDPNVTSLITYVTRDRGQRYKAITRPLTYRTSSNTCTTFHTVRPTNVSSWSEHDKKNTDGIVITRASMLDNKLMTQ